MKKQIYCFIGLPASGKGTQAISFAEARRLTHIGIGDLVREEMEINKSNDQFIIDIRNLYSGGKPVTDEIIFTLLKKKLNKTDGGVVFDNFPFNEAQSNFLNRYAKINNWEEPIIIYIKINPESAIKRISSRRICPKCKAVYTGGDVCEKCGEKLVSRSDDNEATVRKRIENYMPNIEKVLSLYQKNGKVYEIDGEPEIAEVRKQVEKIS